MPASLSAFARSRDMCPIEAQRLRFVCSATSFAPSTTFSKSRFESPWPCVTMQKRCAPAASAARACSRICSGVIIACVGVGASAKRDCAQKPQSSAQPPDLALTREHRSVESPKRSTRASNARSTSARIWSWSSICPRSSASSYVINGGKLDLQLATVIAAKVCGRSDGLRPQLVRQSEALDQRGREEEVELLDRAPAQRHHGDAMRHEAGRLVRPQVLAEGELSVRARG